MILSFWTDSSGQTMQTQRSSLIWVYTVCCSICIVWMLYNVAKTTCSIFRVTTANFSGIRIFGNFMVISLLIAGCEYLVQYWWHTAAVGRPHCQGPDHARLSVYQAVWSRNEGMGGKTCNDAGYPRWMVEGWRYSLYSKRGSCMSAQ